MYMSQSPVRIPAPKDGADRQAGRPDLLDSLAVQALAQVANQVRAGRADPDGSALERLYSAAVGADPRACAEVARALIANGVLAERICDIHIAATALKMGDDWISDDLTFTAVTIGTARLQGLLRELDLDLERSAGHASRGASSAVMLVVAPGADHTLGALVLASQLRRRGVSVWLSMGEEPEAMAAVLAGSRFDAVFLSATISESLPFLAEAVAAIRAAMPAPPPLVIGGALLAQANAESLVREGSESDAGRGKASDAAVFAGIDHITNDLDEAIRLCGLTTSP